jgi:hypothetical protein
MPLKTGGKTFEVHPVSLRHDAIPFFATSSHFEVPSEPAERHAKSLLHGLVAASDCSIFSGCSAGLIFGFVETKPEPLQEPFA